MRDYDSYSSANSKARVLGEEKKKEEPKQKKSTIAKR